MHSGRSTAPARVRLAATEAPFAHNRSSGSAVFWIFVGFGRGKMASYKNLNSSNSATFRNVAFYNTGKNPGAVPGEQFYAELVSGSSAWSRSHR